jgi:hypothetical protein
MNAMRTFDVVPVIRLQSDQHRIELPIFIKWLLFQMISFASCGSPKTRNRHSFD